MSGYAESFRPIARPEPTQVERDRETVAQLLGVEIPDRLAKALQTVAGRISRHGRTAFAEPFSSEQKTDMASAYTELRTALGKFDSSYTTQGNDLYVPTIAELPLDPPAVESDE